MQYIYHKNKIEVQGCEDFDLVKIFECGQCFRWNKDDNGIYHGVVRGKAAKSWSENGKIYISGSEEEFRNLWYDYFDLDRDYKKLRNRVTVDEYMERAVYYGKGIRILRQDKWEALCSFIISQCNNIPRIKKIIESLCALCGDEIVFEGKIYYSFPSPEKLATMNAFQLAPIRAGYRTQYIIDAAKKVANGDLDLEKLSKCSYSETLKALKLINGVGDKVANCVILFGLNISDAFPVDVWMKKVLREHYPDGLDPCIFGDAAGLAQQYMFYYARSGEGML